MNTLTTASFPKAQLDAPVGISFTQAFARAREIQHSTEKVSAGSRLEFVEATAPESQRFISDVATDRAFVSVHIGAPDHPVTLAGYGMDPELLEVSVLAAQQRTGRNVLDLVQLPGWTADSLVPKELIAKIRDLKNEGLVRHWGVRARTVKQAMRAMSFLGLSYVSINATDLGEEAVCGILRAACRANVSVIVSVSANTTAEEIEQIAARPCVLGVLIDVQNDRELAVAKQTFNELHQGRFVQIA